MIRGYQLWIIRLGVVLALYGAVCWPISGGHPSSSCREWLFFFLLGGGAALAYLESRIFAKGVIWILTSKINDKKIKYLLVAEHRIPVNMDSENKKVKPWSTVLFAYHRSRFKVLIVGEEGRVLGRKELGMEDAKYAEVVFGQGNEP